jgi:HK97 family phage prohead protease
MEHKTVPAFLKQVDEDKGVVECIFAIFGNVDEGKDILHPGSFTKTLSERGGKVRILDQHNTDSINRVLGKPLDIREISGRDLPIELKAEYPNATGGVWAKIQFFLNTPEGKGAFIRLKEAGIDEWSFGYDAIDTDYTSLTVNGEKIQVRNLRTVKLFEVSPVLWAMNPATVTLDAKDDAPPAETKRVTPYQNLDLGSRDEAWHGDQVRLRIREWAGGIDDMDWDKYQKGFLWSDSESPETFQAYKLPYADVVDGELVAIPRGIFAAAASIQGARGTPPDIPADDIERVKRNIDRYYAKMRGEFDDEDLIAPWNKEAETEAEVKDEAVTESTVTEEQASSSAETVGVPLTVAGDPQTNEIDVPTESSASGFPITFNLPEGLPEEVVADFQKTVDEALRAMAPPPKEVEAKDGKMMGATRLGDVLQGNIHYVFTCLADKWYIKGLIRRDERLLLSSLIGDALGVLELGMPEDLAGRNVQGPLYADYGYDYYGLTPDLEEKAGRVLSARNTRKIQAALAQLHEVLMEAGMMAEPDEAADAHTDEEEDEEKVATVEVSVQEDSQTQQDDTDLLRLIEIEKEQIEISRLSTF